MRQSNKAILVALLTSIASFPITAQEMANFNFGAGYLPAGELNLQSLSVVEETPAPFGKFRLNSGFGIEGFQADINPVALLSERSSNIYTQSFLGTSLADNSISTVAGVSLFTTLIEPGPVRPFVRAGVHHYDLGGGSGQSLRGDSLMFGAGANIELSKGWQARLEWERYKSADQLDRSIFSASFEYRF